MEIPVIRNVLEANEKLSARQKEQIGIPTCRKRWKRFWKKTWVTE